jgi:outer membrane biosynthesis protein TonB
LTKAPFAAPLNGGSPVLLLETPDTPMSRPSLAVAAVLALTAGAAGCAPQCTCPATAPAPVPVIAVSQPGAPPTQPGAVPTPQPAAQPQPAADGPLRILNDEEVETTMRSLYPGHLADVGVGGDVIVDVTLGANGVVEASTDVRVSNAAFRGPALTVANQLQFFPTPAPGTTLRVRMRWRTTSTSVEVVQR